MYPLFRQHQRSAGRVIEGQAFVITPDNKLHTLNSTGTHVWQQAERSRTLAELAHALEARFEVDPARAEADVKRFCDDLVERQILEVLPR